MADDFRTSIAKIGTRQERVVALVNGIAEQARAAKNKDEFASGLNSQATTLAAAVLGPEFKPGQDPEMIAPGGGTEAQQAQRQQGQQEGQYPQTETDSMAQEKAEMAQQPQP